ncbi:Syntaxin-related protein KNOLLE [Cardamine amara subsp. amara]|uniref:Syntaxin-related protein KNOLLE n=1 Tax=Cardamine amara subsp. amara TaxID=228776 RepID=A0ABD1AF49_CARAN
MNDLMTKSFMSYVDLKKAAMKDMEAGPDFDLEMGSVKADKMDENLSSFLEEAEQVKAEMGLISETLSRIAQYNDESKGVHKADSVKSLRDKISNEIVSVLRKAKSIKSKLAEMEKANKEIKRLSGTPVYRSRTAVTNGLRKKLKDVMLEFQVLRMKMMNEYKEAVERRYFTVTGEHPDKEMIEKIITNNAAGEDFLTCAIQEHGKGKVLDTVVDIQDRYDAAKEIEKSLLELHQVFMDMAVIVDTQGEQMDEIEHHVLNASHYVKDGANELRTARTHQRSSRKWMCIGIIAVLLIILLIIIPIVASFTSS